MWLVKVQSASGRTKEVRVAASSERDACKTALGTLPESEQWLAIWALEQ